MLKKKKKDPSTQETVPGSGAGAVAGAGAESGSAGMSANLLSVIPVGAVENRAANVVQSGSFPCTHV